MNFNLNPRPSDIDPTLASDMCLIDVDLKAFAC